MNDELVFLNKQLASTKKSISNIMTAIEQGIILKSTKERLAELEEAQSKLEYQISMCELSEPELTEEQIIFMLNQYVGYDLGDEEYCADMIECFVNSVYLSDEKLIVTYNLTNEKSELVSSDLDLIGGGEGS